ncbi:hypothetical protein V5799_024789 [Amblyomma americanum]|uniref:Uncharacterized protein n=1 Tax=Amblyomma americanum TaxID=6943 RepID=A0AAQ4EBJ5_AMBAM
MHHEKYGPHMRNFVRDNTLGACVWVCALCLAVLVTLRMSKLIWGDIAAVVFLCKRNTAERRKGVTRNDAFQAAELALLATDTSRMEPLPVGKEQRFKLVSILGPITASRAVSAQHVGHNQKCPDVNPAVAPDVVELHGVPESSDALHPSHDNANQSHVLVEPGQTLKPQGAPHHCHRFTGFVASIFLNEADNPFMSRQQIDRACVVTIVVTHHEADCSGDEACVAPRDVPDNDELCVTAFATWEIDAEQVVIAFDARHQRMQEDIVAIAAEHRERELGEILAVDKSVSKELTVVFAQTQLSECDSGEANVGSQRFHQKLFGVRVMLPVFELGYLDVDAHF